MSHTVESLQLQLRQAHADNADLWRRIGELQDQQGRLERKIAYLGGVASEHRNKLNQHLRTCKGSP